MDAIVPAKAPTLVDIARLAGVSVSTAGRVLRQPDNKVDPELAARVQAAAAELGYMPNVAARALRGAGAAMVGLVVGDMVDPYYGEIAELVTQAAEREHGIVAIVSNMQRDALLELKHIERLCGHRVAGLILAGGGFDQWTYLDRFAALMNLVGRAGVTVTSLAPRGIDIPTFCVDNEQVGAVAAAKLAALGHRRVGLLLGPPNSEVTQQRLRGAIKALTEAGSGFVVRHAPYAPEDGSAAVREMVAQMPELTGFLVGADTMAIGVLDGLARAGRSVPADASVISIGNTRSAAWSSPTLTTVDVAVGEYARAALRHIAAHVAGEPAPAPPAIAPTVVDGRSIAPPGG
ncbi:LacI family DNA-binding transcriptional regulator [Phytohabitans kaempferiae]|uniref:LacI family DNA-binding transcriptional regulator n=1 Tax=Phytohabitans kaempferiae TaxID=1620943 RepID=A0ABV6MH39_9ACTN